MHKTVHAMLLALLCSQASAQTPPPQIPDSAYRPGMPEVLTPAAAPVGPAFDFAGFAATYAGAGKPAVAVLWNRQFTDVLEQGSTTALTIDSAGIKSVQYDASGATAASARRTTLSAQEVKGRQAERAAPAEHRDLQMRSAFMQTMARAGLRLVDRNVVMRKSAAAQKGQIPDVQHVETEVLAEHAKLLMEVLNTPDPESPTGWATYVSVKRMADGVVLTEAYVDGKAALPPPPPKRFVADSRGGYVEARPDKVVVSMGDTGRRAAEVTMQNLQQALARP
jgi:hypothetical protein